ncbi:MAG: KH domain-containing protein [Atribacterota bacterium]
MRDIIEFLLKEIVNFPDRVQINEINGDNLYVLEISVDSTDVGKIIGKQGRVIKAIRTIVKAATIKDDKKTIIKISE